MRRSTATGPAGSTTSSSGNRSGVHLFHYHLVTSQLRQVEARYVAKLGFRLVARHGRIGDSQLSYESGVPWEELDRLCFKLRLTELEHGAVNVVIQPGHWRVPRVEHISLWVGDAAVQAGAGAGT